MSKILMVMNVKLNAYLSNDRTESCILQRNTLFIKMQEKMSGE